ncbi:MAG: hypothetical protein V7720_06440 [Halioglobus sp.]
MKESLNSERRKMRIGDWFYSTTNVVLGLLAGIMVFGLVQLITTGFWPVAIIIIVGFAGLLLLDDVMDRFVDWLFPSGIRASRIHYKKAKAPVIRLLSFPLGFVSGGILAHLGLGNSLIEMLP